MKRSKISNNVIRRLPRYLRKLEELSYNGTDRISSSELGKQMGLTPSQIRQDFSCFGEFGQQGYGYNVDALKDEISTILGVKRGFNAILVGAGNLGHALIGNFNFKSHGFSLVGVFDVDPKMVGEEIMDTHIYDSSEISSFLKEHQVDIAILTVPRRVANSTACELVENGIKAIWNFTNIELAIDDSTVLVEDIHFSDSLMALSYYLSESLDDSSSNQ